MRINIKSPIISGKSIGGIELGTKINNIEEFENFEKESIINEWFPNPRDFIIYKSESINFWTNKGFIDQIMAYEKYEGKLFEVIGIGSTIRDIEKYISSVYEDYEDNLAIEGIKGLCFEVQSPTQDINNTPISEIFVFSEELY
jgi:hypothetical protein